MNKKSPDTNNTFKHESVPTQIKNLDLVRKRRQQIINVAVNLFVTYGYHKATTRMIAKEAGFSIGSLYEYIGSKEDILYLVCETIHSELERGIKDILTETKNLKESLSEMIRGYFRVCDHMSDHILLMYQATQFLPAHWKNNALENELHITNIFVQALQRDFDDKNASILDTKVASLIGHNIVVLGQMWAFRRWYFAKQFTIEEFIEEQTRFILKPRANHHISEVIVGEPLEC